MEIGFIGLGNLGTVMVQNLIESGHKLHIYNRTQQKMQPFAQTATLHNSIASLAQACNIILSIVSDDAAVNAITLGNDGLVQHMQQGSVHVCLSTIAPATAAQLHKAHAEKNTDYITATIIGRPDAAKARALTICVSGTTKEQEALQQILKDLGGKNIYHYGDDPRNAAIAKVCNNFLIVAAIEAMGEAFHLAEKAGADAALFYQMITETVFNSPIYKNYGKIIINKTYDQAGFTSQLGLKDTKLALSLADEVSAPLPLADLVKNHFYVNHNRGRAQQDWTSIVKVIEEEGRKGS